MPRGIHCGMTQTYTAGSAAAVAVLPMRHFRGVARALDGPGWAARRWRQFRPVDVGRAAVAAQLTRYGLTAAEAAVVVLSLGDDLAGMAVQLSKNPKQGFVVDQQREGLPPW